MPKSEADVDIGGRTRSVAEGKRAVERDREHFPSDVVGRFAALYIRVENVQGGKTTHITINSRIA